MSNKLYLVGAGPGDPELMTLKSVKVIQSADVILYDALVNPEILAWAPSTCLHVYAGKRKGNHAMAQDSINEALVAYTRRYKTVVRLKGGDPFVFGRGQEEVLYAEAHGIETHVIPGISSALAAPSLAGIPLTLRGRNESFWVVTGTCTHGLMSDDLLLATRSSATVVVLMGLSQLKKIAALVCTLRSPDEPMAVVQDASLPNQRVVAATASVIFQNVENAGIASPAVIVIGSVASEQVARQLYSRVQVKQCA